MRICQSGAGAHLFIHEKVKVSHRFHLEGSMFSPLLVGCSVAPPMMTGSPKLSAGAVRLDVSTAELSPVRWPASNCVKKMENGE